MFPAILYALLENGNQIQIKNAVVQTQKPLIIYDTETYRDTPSLVTGGAAGTIATSGQLPVVQIAGGVNPTVSQTSPSASIYFVEATGASSVSEEDAYKHVPKRFVPKLDTICEFWDDTLVGLAMTISVTTTLNSATITVPDATLLTPGQGITGTGIPAGTIILNILSQSNGVITTTTAVMSQQATAAGTVAGTLTGSNLVGRFKYSEFLGWGSQISTPD